MSFRAALVGVVMLLVVAIGGLVLSGWNSVSGFMDKVEAKQGICSTLADGERLELIGVETPKKMLDVEGALDPYTCRWAAEDTSGATFVQVVSAPADEWAVEVTPLLIDQAASLGPERARRLRAAASAPVSRPADGCRLHHALTRIGGIPDGPGPAVTSSTTSTGAPMVTASRCEDGTYTAVMVAAPDLELDRALGRAAARALRLVEKRLG